MRRGLLFGACFLSYLFLALGCSDKLKSRPEPIIPGCADDVLQDGEVCDDGNTEGGDGCSADCLSDESCGNGIVDSAAGERCDDSNATGGDGCSADCRSTEVCGDSYVDTALGEECDPGTASDSVVCDSDCTSVFCGDGHANAAVGEVCDDAGASATCTAGCTSTTCGDGIVNAAAGEACDAGGESIDCDLDCTLPICGDLVLNLTAGEACDDGNLSDLDGCLATCQLNICGDGLLNPLVEACDDFNLITEIECLYGVPTCLACDATCENVLELVGGWCGDGLVTHLEECDSRSVGACGACSATCDEQTLERATGSITASAGSDVDDGDSVTIADGLDARIVFELDSDGLVGGGAVRVPFTDGSLAAGVARALGNAINGSSLRVRANVSGAVISLEHDIPGSIGNQPISVNGPFSASGLSGGEGYNCAEGMGCVQDADCDPRLVCGTEGTCEAP